MLRKLIKRQRNYRSPSNERGHSGHWQCIYDGRIPQLLAPAAQQLIRRHSPTYIEDKVALYHSSGNEIRLSILRRGPRILTMFPQVIDGPAWPVEISRVTPWRNGVEGQITGNCLGTEVCFYDTSFFNNRRKYRTKETVDFRMGAIAYRLGPAHDLEADVEGGAKVSLKGAHAFMPAGKVGEGADIDDYWFHSPLDGPTVTTMVNKVELRGYPITLALPHDFPMSLTLYAAGHVEAPGTRDLARDDDLQGYLWLQGYHE
jgi:hypothetical protein